MLIAIPSKGRPGRVKSADYITTATVFVPEDEVDVYRRTGSRNVIGVPPEIKGITATRNWILDQAKDPWVVFIDDDLKVAGWHHLRHRRIWHRRLTEAEMVGEWRKFFCLTEELGYRIWGMATDGAPQSVYPWRPFIFHTYVTASAMGILNHTGLRFDERFPVKEDYELCLRCLKEDGGVLGVRYMFWHNSHWADPGGCKTYRTQAMEDDAIGRLIAMYPGLIRKVTKGGSHYSIELDF